LAQLPKVLHDLGLSVLDCGHRTLVDRYLDTPKASVQASGWALRFRSGESEDGKLLRTLKALSPSDGDGLSEREEIESWVESIDKEWKGDALSESFKIFQDRWWWRACNGDCEIEASYDLVQWRKSLDGQTLCDEAFAIELELKLGTPSNLTQLASELSGKTGWHPAQWSKFSRGLDLK
jgi:inorganic triphosphatase YgiF